MDLHMNGGKGETSYANNSLLQRETIYKTKEILEATVRMVCSTIMSNTMNIADLGCSSGPNSLLPVSMILDAVQDSCARLGQSVPAEFHVFLNDVPENDFNTVFEIIPSFREKLRVEKGAKFGSCFICGSPGTFYGRLFPTQSLHFVYSANSLHWLSKIPSSLNEELYGLNKGNIALGMTSPSSVFEAYSEQFRRDFFIFLKSRSQEIVPKGCMVLSFHGRRTKDPFDDECFHGWDYLAHALGDMVEEGIVEEAKLGTFNMPYYEPHIDEVRKTIEEEGSFDIIQLDAPCRATDCIIATSEGMNIYNVLANCTRALTEPILSSHFGPAILDELFKRFEEKLPHVANKKAIFLILSLTRKE